MNTAWFKPFGWIYIPVHSMGTLVTILAIIFLLPVYIIIRKKWAFSK